MMVSFGVLSGDDSNKMNDCMLKGKPRKVSAARNFPPRCGRNVVLIDVKAGEISASKDVDLEAGSIRNLPGGDGMMETDLMEVDIESLGAGDKSYATGHDTDSGGVIKSGVGFDVFIDGVGIVETDLTEVEIESFGARDTGSGGIKISDVGFDVMVGGDGISEIELIKEDIASSGDGDRSYATSKDMDSGGIQISNVGFEVLLDGDGILETDLIKVEIDSSGAGDKSYTTGEDLEYGSIKVSNVGVDSESHESGTSRLVVNMADLVDAPAKELTETGSRKMQLQNKVDSQTDEAMSVPIKTERAESLDAMVGLVAVQVDAFSTAADEPSIEARVTGVYLMNNMSNNSLEGSTEVERGRSTLKELNEMDGLASGYNSKTETKPVLGYASAEKILQPGSSHLMSSTYEYNKPEYSMSDRIKFRRRKVSAVRDFPPTLWMKFSSPKEDHFLDSNKNLDVEREATVSYGSKYVVHNSIKNVGGRHGKKSIVSSLDSNDKVRPRDNNFTTGKELHGEVVHGLMAAPYCPWRNGKISIGKTDSGGKVKQTKRKRSEGRSKRRAFHDWLDKDGSSGSSTFLKNELDSSNSTGATSGVEMQKNNPFWRNKSEAVARKTICSEKNSVKKANNDFPEDSRFSGNTKDFDIRLPRLGHKYQNCGDARSRVREILMYFHCICRKLLQKEEGLECRSKLSGKKLTRPDLAALNTIKDEGKALNTEKQILGEVPGVEVGDEFQYRAELAVVGMHRHLQAGIDTMEHEGVPVAISIVASGSYNDDTEHADVLIYSGQGGNIVGKNKNYEDQKLVRGNLALSNSMKKGTPVRVVRGWRETVTGTDPFDSKSKLVSIYYYDGLYTVKRYWSELGSHGKFVYKFELIRNPNQPELAWKELKKACKSKVREGVCIRDISHGRESFPICAVNVLDDEKPPEFTYISKMLYPDWYSPSPPMGCDCVGRCNDSRKCGCAIRNGGEIPYNRNGAIVESKPYVYECGPHCKCPPTCYNRVTQRGIKVRLEIFKTDRRGWGLRALTSVPSGTFICEYAGELLEDKEAEKRIGYDEYLFDIGQNCVDSVMNYEDQTVSVEIAEEGGYTIDACRYGNLGRFVNHSCSPNLYGQNVIYDHDDKKMPHVMLFATENIPPFKELTYHYNYKLDQVIDSNGNVKVKKCFCGSADCSGRMY